MIESIEKLLCIAKLGFRIFPCWSMTNGGCACGKPNCLNIAKHPATPHGSKDATTDEAQIRRWLTDDNGRFNWAIATGDGFGVMDIDPGHDGDESWLSFGLDCKDIIADTLSVQTGSGGRHYYYRLPDGVTIGNRAGLRPGLDWRGDGGYVLIPPSLHRCGKHYEWLTQIDTPMALASERMIGELKKQSGRVLRSSSVKLVPLPQTANLFDRVVSEVPDSGIIVVNGIVTVVTVGGVEDLTNAKGVGEGRRNATLCRLTGVHLAKGESLEKIEETALAWNARCHPPEDEALVLATVRSLWDKQYKKREDTLTVCKPELQPPPQAECLTAPGGGKEGKNSGSSGVLSFLPASAAEFFPSFPNGTAATAQTIESGSPFCSSSSSSSFVPASPGLEPDAYHGLLGDIVRAIEPETEADGAGVLLSLLVAFGNAVGSKPGFQVGAEVHRTNLFLCLVGNTASGKGQAWSIAKRLMQAAEGEWCERCIVGGLSSGEGLVERLKDEELEPRVEGKTVTALLPSAGTKDKRLLALETEFAKPITAMRRDGNTLSPLLRAAWDCSTLEVMTRSNKIRATGSHFSIVAHITPEELESFFSKGTEVANGFANRFLWCGVKRQRLLPHGGNISVLDRFKNQLAQAIASAKEIGILDRTPEAGALWEKVYPALAESKPGAYGKAVERSRPQVMRLALVYALADGSPRIGAVHLRAALAVWRYCDASAGKIFGSGAVNTKERESHPEPFSVRLLNAITARPGMSRSDMLRAYRDSSADEIDRALVWLKSNGMAHSQVVQAEGGGRPAECWYPGSGSAVTC